MVYDCLLSKPVAMELGRSSAMLDYCGDMWFSMETPHSSLHRKTHPKCVEGVEPPRAEARRILSPPSHFLIPHNCLNLPMAREIGPFDR
jgi:hypothetical protein